jgi:hypothetical protein
MKIHASQTPPGKNLPSWLPPCCDIMLWHFPTSGRFNFNKTDMWRKNERGIRDNSFDIIPIKSDASTTKAKIIINDKFNSCSRPSDVQFVPFVTYYIHKYGCNFWQPVLLSHTKRFFSLEVILFLTNHQSTSFNYRTLHDVFKDSFGVRPVNLVRQSCNLWRGQCWRWEVWRS